jgi:hypothetical protein
MKKISDSCPPNIRWGDFIIAVLIIVLGLFTLTFLPDNTGEMAYVYLDNILIARYSLSGNAGEKLIRGKNGPVQLKIDESGIRVSKSPCPSRICMRMGSINRQGQSIICIPNHVLIIIGKNKDQNPDGITR